MPITDILRRSPDEAIEPLRNLTSTFNFLQEEGITYDNNKKLYQKISEQLPSIDIIAKALKDLLNMLGNKFNSEKHGYLLEAVVDMPLNPGYIVTQSEKLQNAGFDLAEDHDLCYKIIINGDCEGNLIKDCKLLNERGFTWKKDKLLFKIAIKSPGIIGNTFKKLQDDGIDLSDIKNIIPTIIINAFLEKNNNIAKIITEQNDILAKTTTEQNESLTETFAEQTQPTLD